MRADEGNVLGNNEAKYDARNPLARWMVSSFLESARELFQASQPRQVLEVGWGEGALAARLVAGNSEVSSYLATDLDLSRLPADQDPRITAQEASVYDLPFPDSSFDTVVCCEVLEHLSDPETAMAEVARVARRRVLISTPWEPTWRILNMARGKYLGHWGNTPGHLQHFSRRDLVDLVSSRARVLQVKRPVPWTMILADVTAD